MPTADPRGAYLSVSQSLPDNRVRIFTHTIIINSLIYSRISATLFLLKTPISSPHRARDHFALLAERLSPGGPGSPLKGSCGPGREITASATNVPDSKHGFRTPQNYLAVILDSAQGLSPWP